MSESKHTPDADSWEANAEYLLARCPHTVRQRPGGGPEDIKSSLVVTFMGMQQDLAAERRKVEALEKDAERWQPIETADSNALALLYAPPEALFVEPAKHLGEFRVAAPRNWTWATHWMPLPAPPAIDAALSEKGRT